MFTVETLKDKSKGRESKQTQGYNKYKIKTQAAINSKLKKMSFSNNCFRWNTKVIWRQGSSNATVTQRRRNDSQSVGRMRKIYRLWELSGQTLGEH